MPNPYFRHGRYFKTPLPFAPPLCPRPHHGSFHFISPLLDLPDLDSLKALSFPSFEDFTKRISSSISPAFSISLSSTMNSNSVKSTLILFFASNFENSAFVKSSAGMFCSLGAQARSISSPNFCSWQASSITTMDKGYLQDINFCKTKVLPRLSVTAVMVTWALLPFHSAPGANSITAINTATNSKEDIVRKGSPLTYAHGAVLRVNSTLNHLASDNSRWAKDSQPPTTIFSPSALASIRKTSVGRLGHLLAGCMLQDFSCSATNPNRILTASGNCMSVRAHGNHGRPSEKRAKKWSDPLATFSESDQPPSPPSCSRLLLKSSLHPTGSRSIAPPVLPWLSSRRWETLTAPCKTARREPSSRSPHPHWQSTHRRRTAGGRLRAPDQPADGKVSPCRLQFAATSKPRRPLRKFHVCGRISCPPRLEAWRPVVPNPPRLLALICEPCWYHTARRNGLP